MESYKLQIWLDGDEQSGGKPQFRDLYFDVSKISGFYIPNDLHDMDGDKGINVFKDWRLGKTSFI